MNDVSNQQLERLRKALIDQLEWGPVEQWHSSMFAELAQRVFESTEIKLSPTTIKRFFGVLKYDGSPSISTFDALSAFLGYKNWRAFKQTPAEKPSKLLEGISHKFIYGIIGFLAAIIFIFLIANRSPSLPASLPEGVSFSSRTLTNTYPNSVVFDFDLMGIASDSLLIQQDWDPNRTIAIERDQKQATGIYYYPGYFRAKLLVDGNIIKRHDLFLRSNGWLGTIEHKPVPKYFIPLQATGTLLSYPPSIYKEVTSSDQPLEMSYHYVNDLGNVSGDHFELRATIKNSYADLWAVCQTSKIYILGTDGAMIIPLTKIGCSSDINLMLNDNYQNGKQHDLSNFGTSLGEETIIKIVNHEKEVSILFDGDKIYSGSYQETMGRMVGLRFKFLGGGEVKDLEWIDQSGHSINL